MRVKEIKEKKSTLRDNINVTTRSTGIKKYSRRYLNDRCNEIADYQCEHARAINNIQQYLQTLQFRFIEYDTKINQLINELSYIRALREYDPDVYLA